MSDYRGNLVSNVVPTLALVTTAIETNIRIGHMVATSEESDKGAASSL